MSRLLTSSDSKRQAHANNSLSQYGKHGGKCLEKDFIRLINFPDRLIDIIFGYLMVFCLLIVILPFYIPIRGGPDSGWFLFDAGVGIGMLIGKGTTWPLSHLAT